jgi:Virus neck protein
MGHDIYYLPRESWTDTDEIFGENMASRFDRAYQMEMYICNVEGYEGENELFTKFGLEIREGSNFIVAKKTFDKYIPTNITIRPREGDLLFVPVMNRIFEIKFVEEELLFFGKGLRTPYIYELRCELFRYNNEKINTGVEVIDDIDVNASYTVELAVTGTGNYNIGEVVYQGANLNAATVTAKVGNWDPNARKLYLVDINGTFANNSNIIGASTNTRGSVYSTDTLGDHVYYDFFNNKQIQTEADSIIDFSEINPFGKP